MKNRDYQKLSFELAKYSEDINLENKRRYKKLNEYEKLQIKGGDFTPMFLVMLADIAKEYGISKYENLIHENEKEKREIENFMKNISERLEIIKESEKMGLEISNENFEKSVYDFVSSSENIKFEDSEEMREIIEKLEEKYNSFDNEQGHKQLEEQEHEA